MLKRTLVFSNPGHLSLKLDQLVYQPKSCERGTRTIPVEDIGFVLIETPQITITTASLHFLAKNNITLIICDEKHMPCATLTSLASHTTTQKQITAQLKATEALKERLWRQTVKAKLENQATCLERGNRNGSKRIRALIRTVKKGDVTNCEAIAARLYFQTNFENETTRDRFGEMPNAALNYGYAILRAATARALIGSGLTCLIGIHHHNQYNAFVLADDIMEPYRPFVDDLIFNTPTHLFTADAQELTKEMKAHLLSVLTLDVMLTTMRRPLMNALSYTTASLARCFLKEEKEIVYPRFPPCPAT